MHLKLSFLLLLSCLAVHGSQAVSTDSIQLPAKVMELPNVIKELDPTILGFDRVGVWAMPTLVALRYGLVVSDTLDQRLDNDAATYAAKAYFCDLFNEFNDWDLCYIAYLYSPAYVRSLKARHLDSIIDNFDIKNHNNCFICQAAPPKPILKPEENKKSNDTNKPKSTQPKQKEKFITYIVKRGDTLTKIAKKHKVTIADIKKWNNLKNDLIREDQKLKIKQ